MSKILYVDMDGTMFDLYGEMIKRGYSPDHYTDEYLFNRDIYGYEYDRGLFRDMPVLPIAKFLTSSAPLIHSHFTSVKFLTYVGNHEKIATVIRDKRVCLENNGFEPHDMIAVEGNKFNKQFFARPDTILFDDCQRTIDLFDRVDGATGIKVDPFSHDAGAEAEAQFLQSLGI